MTKLGITGGIGSGKSVVSAYLQNAGIPVYNCDNEAKRLMVEDKNLVGAIRSLLGAEAYSDGRLNRAFIAQCIFGNPDLLKQMNAIVHPAVIADFEKWSLRQHLPVVAMETAILFESGFDRIVDIIINVSADENTRIQRAMQRDGAPRSVVESRIKNQMSDPERIRLSHFVIDNNDDVALTPQIEKICNSIERKSF